MNDDRLQRLTDAVEQTRDHLETIEDIIDAERGHAEAKQKDARDQLEVGDSHKVVIQDAPGESGADAVARIGGIVTFVEPNGAPLDAGTTARVKLTNVQDSFAHAIVVDVLD